MANRNVPKINQRNLDILEQVVLLLLCTSLFVRLYPRSFSEVKLYLLLVLLSEGIVVVLLLIRKPTENISDSLKDWFVAFSGSFLPLLINKGGDPFMPNVGVTLILLGLLIHIGAKLCLFRSFGIVPANRGVKIKGFYAYVRHPMYAGYFLTHLGYLIAAPTLWNFTIYTCVWGLLLYRIFAEERVLLQSLDYKEYIKRVHYRVIPGIF